MAKNPYKLQLRSRWLALMAAVLLTACGGFVGEMSLPTPSEMPAEILETQSPIRLLGLKPGDTPNPTATATPKKVVEPKVASPTQAKAAPDSALQTSSVSEPTADTATCSGLLSPENHVEMAASGWVVFSWDPRPDAARYLLEVTVPSGWALSIETEETSHTRALGAFSSGGEYSWTVTALGAEGNEICQAEPYLFIKPAFEPTGATNKDEPRYSNKGEPVCKCQDE